MLASSVFCPGSFALRSSRRTVSAEYLENVPFFFLASRLHISELEIFLGDLMALFSSPKSFNSWHHLDLSHSLRRPALRFLGNKADANKKARPLQANGSCGSMPNFLKSFLISSDPVLDSKSVVATFAALALSSGFDNEERYSAYRRSSSSFDRPKIICCNIPYWLGAVHALAMSSIRSLKLSLGMRLHLCAAP